MELVLVLRTPEVASPCTTCTTDAEEQIREKSVPSAVRLVRDKLCFFLQEQRQNRTYGELVEP